MFELVEPKSLRLTWKEIDCAMHLLAHGLKKRWTENELSEFILVPIVRGGLIPCGILSHLVPCKVKGAITVSTYGNKTTPGTPRILHTAPISSTEHKIIFVDDIIDSGTTAKALSHYYPTAIFVTPIGKQKGLSVLSPTRLPILPPIVVGDNEWIEFPWNSNLKPQDKKEGPHG